VKNANESSGNALRSSYAAPSITLPKGGGAILGIAEKFAANPAIGLIGYGLTKLF